MQTFDDLEATHVEGIVDYAMSPPAGGPHNQVWLNCGIYSEPVPNENAVHDLEHGAVWITYAPDLPQADIDKLKAQARPSTYVVLSPYRGSRQPDRDQRVGCAAEAHRPRRPGARGVHRQVLASRPTRPSRAPRAPAASTAPARSRTGRGWSPPRSSWRCCWHGRVPDRAAQLADSGRPRPTTSAAAGFLRDMQVHHAQAVDMAMTIRDISDDPDLRRLAYDIALGAVEPGRADVRAARVVGSVAGVARSPR